MDKDYKKLYEEALERAKIFKSPYCQHAAEVIFPELKESEDEMIRKAIIRHIKDKVSVILGWRKEELIAWLEKQGEQKPAAWSEEDEKFVVDTMNFLYRAKNQYAQTARLEECIDWLKSIKPNHWKPSEYDISLLEEIARNIRNNVRPFCSEVSALEDLIKNLKNL